MVQWNWTTFQKAAGRFDQPPANYSVDGTSGVLDVAREVQLRIKLWAYAYRLSGDARWKERIWEEVAVASGNSSHYFGVDGDNWNSESVS